MKTWWNERKYEYNIFYYFHIMHFGAFFFCCARQVMTTCRLYRAICIFHFFFSLHRMCEQPLFLLKCVGCFIREVKKIKYFTIHCFAVRLSLIQQDTEEEGKNVINFVCQRQRSNEMLIKNWNRNKTKQNEKNDIKAIITGK